MQLPFISVRAHREVVAAKDETIALLRETNQRLYDGIEALKELALSLKPQAIERRPKSETQPKPAVNYARLNPDDNDALAAVAMAELGPGKHSIGRVAQKVEHIKRQIEYNRAHPPPFASAPSPAAADLIEQAVAEGEALAKQEMGVN